jgi:hypothetical protein
VSQHSSGDTGVRAGVPVGRTGAHRIPTIKAQHVRVQGKMLRGQPTANRIPTVTANRLSAHVDHQQTGRKTSSD